jgi:thiol-disulfide isomerase/thioredoxin
MGRSTVRSLATVLVVALSSSAGTPTPLRHLAPGTRAPDVTVERLSGGTLSLSSLKGKVVIIDFWASWCPPCRAELPWLVKLAQRNEARGVFFVAMNQDEAPQRSLASSVTGDVPGLDRFVTLGGPAVGALFHVDGLPTLYLLDRQGRVFASAEGRLTEAALSDALDRALAP